MRSFIAIPVDVPDAMRNCIEKLKSSIEGDINWVPEKNIHLTVQFLGELSGETINQLSSDLQEIPIELSDYQMKITGIGFFRNHGRPSVIWMGINAAPWITRMYEQITELTLKRGIAKSEKPFLPHITIGRIKKIKEPEKLLNIAGCYSFLRTGIIHAAEINLYESILKNEGPDYRILFSRPLPQL